MLEWCGLVYVYICKDSCAEGPNTRLDAGSEISGEQCIHSLYRIDGFFYSCNKSSGLGMAFFGFSKPLWAAARGASLQGHNLRPAGHGGSFETQKRRLQLLDCATARTNGMNAGILARGCGRVLET